MASKPTVEMYRNIASGHVHAVNPGSAAHAHCQKGVMLGEFERVSRSESSESSKSGK